MRAAIELDRLTKVFYSPRSFNEWVRAPWRCGQQVTALKDVSLRIAAGELVCVMGSNGAGKTTLLKILTGLLIPTRGTVTIAGCTLRSEADWKRMRSQVGLSVGERPGLYDRLTGRQNLAFFAALYGLRGLAAKRRIDELLELFEVAQPNQSYQEYSTGMKQRALLARALLHDPPILLLDEPTRSLDPIETDAVHTLITTRLHHTLGKTILLTTHQVWEAERLAQRLAILHDGSLRAHGTIEEFAGVGGLEAVIKRLCGGG